MNKIGLIILMIFSNTCLAQRFAPEENRILSYRVVGFSVPNVSVDNYRLEIAYAYYDNIDSFKQHIAQKIAATGNRIVSEVPFFDRQYTWRVVAIINYSERPGEMHHFSTFSPPDIRADSTRLRVISNNYPVDSYKYIFIDGNKALYDLDGNPVWYLTNLENKMTPNSRPRDLKISPYGTITCLVNELIYEINYNCDILWKPRDSNKDKSGKMDMNNRLRNFFHHEFTRLANGNYMALGMEYDSWEIPNQDTTLQFVPNSRVFRDSITHKLCQQMLLGKIVEFNGKGEILWSWSASQYLRQSDLHARRIKGILFDLLDPHENAFYFDEDAKAIYVSFRNLNRIIKLQYPSGHVLSTYGIPYTPGDLELNNNIFCGQHGCRLSHDGLLYMYNNNSCNHPCHLPTIVMVKQQLSSKGEMQKVWEYECTIDSVYYPTVKGKTFESGGNVIELPDRTLLCCMGNNSYCKIFIIDRNKRVLWSAFPEVWNKTENKWRIAPSYRASIITRKELESLIWKAQSEN